MYVFYSRLNYIFINYYYYLLMIFNQNLILHFVLFICILGAIMILLGLKMFDNQMFIIIGGICFAPTIALIIVKDFLEYINVDRNNNKN